MLKVFTKSSTSHVLTQELKTLLGEIAIVSKDADFYDASSPWNTRCNPVPFAVIRPRNAQDVSQAVKFAAKHDIPVQAKCGGHSFGSHSLGGGSGSIIIDLVALNEVKVYPEDDPTKVWKADIGGGTRLGSVTDELYRQGQRAIAHGTCPTVGIGGHATIGGQGPTSRLWGLTLDHVIGAEIVLADGSIKEVSDENEPDLFWAIRGAGASFGVITRFTVATHQAINEVEYYTLQYALGEPAHLSKAFQEWQSYLLTPSTLNDRYFNSVCSIGSDSFTVRGSRLEGPGPRAEKLDSKLDVHFGEHIKVKDDWKCDWLAHAEKWAQDEIFNFFGGKQASSYIKGMAIPQSTPLTEEATMKFFKYLDDNEPGQGLIWFILADYELGRIADFDNTHTPYAHRDALYTIALYVIDPIPGRIFPAKGIKFLDGAVKTIASAMPHLKYGTYPGYIDTEFTADEYPQQYWGPNYKRLKQIKLQYDPENVFRNPQSVEVEGKPRKPVKPEVKGRSCPNCVIS